jgi:cysteine synthase
MTAQAYLEQFTNNIDVVTLCGGTIGTFSKLAQSLAKERNLNTSTLTDAEKTTLKNDAQERYLAVALLLHSDQA